MIRSHGTFLENFGIPVIYTQNNAYKINNYGTKELLDIKKPFLSKERGIAALNTLRGVATLYPDFFGDIALPLYEYGKGALASNKE